MYFLWDFRKKNKTLSKGWSCCKKRVTDFGEFLAIPGCTAGAHNPVKSAQPVKVESKNSGSKEKPDFSKERDAKNYGTEKIISAPPKREILKKDEEKNDDKNVESVHVMKAKVLNSLRSELAKMDLEDKNKAGMSKTVEGLKIMLNTSRDYQNEFLKK